MGLYDRISVEILWPELYQTKSFDEFDEYCSQFADYHIDAEGIIHLKKPGWLETVKLPGLTGEIEFYGPEHGGDRYYKATVESGRMTLLEVLAPGEGWIKAPTPLGSKGRILNQ